MPPKIKYPGQCPEHPLPKRRCNHCQSVVTRERRARGANKATHAVKGTVIYLGLHWPAPDFSFGDCAAGESLILR